MTPLTYYQDHGEPLELVVYRYGHVYIVNGPYVSVYGDGTLSQHQLTFAPTQYAAYGGLFYLLDRDAGIAQFVGHELVAQDSMQSGPYTAPYGIAMCAGEPIDPTYAGPRPTHTHELGGVPFDVMDQVWKSRYVRRTFYSPPTGAQLEPDRHLVFLNERTGFSTYNGVQGDLIHAYPPPQIVPYSYPEQGVLAGGCAHGYLFSPDMGLSWRLRKLSGYGFLTERGIHAVTRDSIETVLGGF